MTANRLIIFLMLMLTFGSAGATHIRPWLGVELQPLLDSRLAVQKFDRVRIQSEALPCGSRDFFFDLGAYFAYAPYSLELETGFAGTSRHHFNWEDFHLTGRYQLMDDITGADIVSLVAGFTVSRTNRRYVEDISTFHHARWEYLFHASVGKEFPQGPIWVSRAWAFGGFGSGDEGSVWLFSHLEYEKNCRDRFWWGAFLKGLFGLGDKPLALNNFTGYGPVEHRSIDIGAHLDISLWEYGYITAQYSYRIWAYNFPDCAHLATLRYEYPFGL